MYEENNLGLEQKPKRAVWPLVVGVVVIILIVWAVVAAIGDKMPDSLPNDPVVNLMQENGGGKNAISLPVSRIVGNTEVLIPNSTVRVVLVDGEAAFSGTNVRGSVVLGDIFAAQASEDGQHDLYAVAHINYGEAQTLQYLMLFRANAQEVEHTSSVLLGDRVIIEEVSVPGGKKNDYTVSVRGLVRNDFEPLTAIPTNEKIWDFFVAMHKLIAG